MPFEHESQHDDFEDTAPHVGLDQYVKEIVRGKSKVLYTRTQLLTCDEESGGERIPVLSLATVKGRAGIVAYHGCTIPIGLQEAFVYNSELGMSQSLALGLPSLFEAVGGVRSRVYDAMFSMKKQQWRKLQNFLNTLRPSQSRLPLGVLVASVNTRALEGLDDFNAQDLYGSGLQSEMRLEAVNYDLMKGSLQRPSSGHVELFTHPALDGHVVLLDIMHKMNMSVFFS